MALENISWLREPSGATEEDIATVERTIGHRFPDDYRVFARFYSGGIPSSMTDFEFREHDGTPFDAVVGVFLSFKDGAEYNLLNALSMAEGWLPKNLIPVIEDPGGDYICLDYRQRETPCISYWRHDRKAFPNEVSFVSDTFTNFLAMLHDPSDDV
jgi:cell wall assembly regulator SMI1